MRGGAINAESERRRREGRLQVQLQSGHRQAEAEQRQISTRREHGRLSELRSIPSTESASARSAVRASNDRCVCSPTSAAWVCSARSNLAAMIIATQLQPHRAGGRRLRVRAPADDRPAIRNPAATRPRIKEVQGERRLHAPKGEGIVCTSISFVRAMRPYRSNCG